MPCQTSLLFLFLIRCPFSFQLLPQSGSALSISEPVGVLGVVLPDSKSLLPLVSLLGAAVAMGNAVVMVPSEKYPLPALEFIQVGFI